MAIEPDGTDADAPRALHVGRPRVAKHDGVRGLGGGQLQRMMEDARIRLGQADFFRRHQVVHQVRQPNSSQLEPLFADDIVGDDHDRPPERPHRSEQRGGPRDFAPVRGVGFPVGVCQSRGVSPADQGLETLFAGLVYSQPSREDLLMELLQQYVMPQLQIVERPALQPWVGSLQLRERGARRVLVIKQGVIEIAEQDRHRIIDAIRRV